MVAIEEEENVEKRVDQQDKDNQDVSLVDEIRPGIDIEDKSSDGKSDNFDQQSEVVQTLENGGGYST